MDQGEQEEYVDDFDSFRNKAKLDSLHPIDLNEDCWFEPLIFGNFFIGAWDRIAESSNSGM